MGKKMKVHRDFVCPDCGAKHGYDAVDEATMEKCLALYRSPEKPECCLDCNRVRWDAQMVTLRAWAADIAKSKEPKASAKHGHGRSQS